MKKQKTVFITLTLLLLVMPILQSCLDDWDKKSDLFGIGTIKIIEGKEYYFALDEGSKLYPGDTTHIQNYTVVDGQRAFVYFSELEERKEGYEYNAQINHIEDILTKEIYSMPADKIDSIGDDRINIIEPIWITGGYLNIKYQFYYSNSKGKYHMLNLVINEAADSENDKPDYLSLEFRHNAYNDDPIMLGMGLVSFKLNMEELGDKKGLNIRIRSLFDGEKFVTVDLKKKGD